MVGDAALTSATVGAALIVALGGILQTWMVVKLERIRKSVDGTARRAEEVTAVLRDRVQQLGGDAVAPSEKESP